MEYKQAPTGYRSLAARTGLAFALAALSLPVLAASSIGLKCESSKASADVSDIEPVSLPKHESLTVLKTDADVGEHESGADFRILEGREAAGRRQAELRSAALADALERRQQRRLALPPEQPVEVSPQVETRLPGVSHEDSLLSRREMYRTDI